MNHKIMRILMIITMILGILVMMISAIEIFSAKNKIFFVFFLLAGILITFTGYVSSRKLTQKISTINEKEKILINIARKRKIPESLSQEIKGDSIIDKWVIPAHEWNLFRQYEKKERRKNIILEIILIIVLGTPFLMLVREASFLSSFFVSIIIAGIYGIFRNLVERKKYEIMSDLDAEIVFFPDNLLVNGKIFQLSADNLYFKKAELVQKNSMNLLIFETWHYSPRNAKIYHEITIPVNHKHMSEAKKIVAYYNDRFDREN